MAKYQIEVQDIVYEIARVLKAIYPESGDLIVHQERIADLHLEDWQDEYSDNDILDGTQWSLKISFDNGKNKEIFGSNKYPDNFEAMKKLFDIN